MPTTAVPVYLEVGSKRVFAGSLDWPGWIRSGKGEEAALTALAEYAPRYAAVAAEAGIPFPGDPAFEIVERLPGSGATEFGVPREIAAADLEPVDPSEGRRLAALVEASWTVMDRVLASAPAELRKGPRGGGRDRDPIAEHVIGAEIEYTRKLGIRVPELSPRRQAILDTLHRAWAPPMEDPKAWPPRYAARRIAWHVLDHAWEIEDRSRLT
jgi:hypothetical protein